MDAQISILGVKIGADAVIGAIFPGVGDIATGVMGLYIVAEARRAGVPDKIIHNMLLNIGIDAAAGVLPVVGDLADALCHSNTTNAALFREYYEREVRSTSTKKSTP